MARTPLRPDRRALGLSVLAAFLLLAGTAEERTFGTVSDEQQMLYTAISIATTGEIGISRNQHFSIQRPGGDAVAPYGMGLPLVEVPFAALAGPWEARFGARTSQTLFVLLQVLLVTAAAAGSGLLAAELGAGAFGQSLAVFGAGLGSPLWAYTAFGFSEPLQAACLVFVVLFALRGSRAEGAAAVRLAAASGFFAGWLVLTKAVNLLFAPLALLPLVLGAWPPGRGRLRTWAAAAAGAAGPLAAMLAFEVVRFGKPFSSYGDQRFAHQFLDGAWRLLVGPNKGLFLYFPLAALALAALPALLRAPRSRTAALVIAALAAASLVVYARWWAWDGSGGWGPRFLTPLVPLLAAGVGTRAASRAGRAAGAALLALGIGVNALGTFEAEAASFFYVSSTGFARVSPELYAEYPASFRPPRERNGEYRLWRYVPAASDAAFSALRVHPFLLGLRLADLDVDARRERLLRPPWLATHPDAVPDLPPPSPMITTRTPLVNYLTAPFRWPHLCMSFTEPHGEHPGTYNPAWFAGLADQTMRSLDIGRPDRAARFAGTLFALSPSGYTAALRLEGLRLSGQEEAARAFLQELPDRALRAPVLRLVLALRARDQGQDLLASTLLAEAARGLRTPAIRSALGRPPAEWPRSLRELLAEVPDAPIRVPAARK
jgi:hypothetical protein